MSEDTKNSWGSSSGFIWAAIGSAVGFANILSFSAKAYFYGGGAFLIPFMIAMLVLGIPLLFLEGVIGQSFGLPVASAFKKANSRYGSILGWLPVFAVTTIGGYYMLLTAWTVAYGYFAAADLIPADTATFLDVQILKKTSSITDFGSFSWILFGCMIIVAVVSWFVVSRRIQSGIERICKIFLPMLAVMVFACAIIVFFLPGAWDGIRYYVIPDFSVLAKPRLWLDTFGHIFFSLSLGLGIITGYSRYADSTINIKRSLILVVLGDFIISVIAGFAIFGCVGYMSAITGTPFTELVKSASPFEMGFVIFPAILKLFGPFLYHIVGPLFFFNVFIAGITGVFSIIEACAGNIEVEFCVTRIKAVTIATAIMTILATIFCYGNGQHMIGAIDPMVAGFNMLLSGISQIIIFLWMNRAIDNHSIWFSTSGKRTYFYYAVKYVIPVILGLVFISSLIGDFYVGFEWPVVIRWGWFVGAVLLAVAFAQFFKKHEKVTKA